ncbi:hypothetical protein ACFOLD_05090 [Kocuria carniphila]
MAFIVTDEGWRDDSSMAVWFMLAFAALYFVMFLSTAAISRLIDQ